FVRSPFGLALRGIREQPRRMRALGYNTWLYQYIAFIVAALFAGIGGVLLAYYNQFVGTSMLDLAQSTQLLIMTIIGGDRDARGAHCSGPASSSPCRTSSATTRCAGKPSSASSTSPP
ncbi:inner-membrane translocator, partial [mine drainage metagenome]